MGTIDITATTYDSILHDIVANESDGQGLFFKPDGTRYYVTGQGNNPDTIQQYDMSTPWDIETSTFTSEASTSLGNAWTDIQLSSDGTRVIVHDARVIAVFSLNTAWDITSIQPYDSLKHSLSWLIEGAAVSDDGEVVYIYESITNSIQEHYLSTPWDMQTISLNHSEPYSLGTANSLWLSLDGMHIFVLSATRYINQFNMSTAFDLSSYSHSGQYDAEIVGVVTRGISFSSDMTNLYTVGNWYDGSINHATIYQYSTDASGFVDTNVSASVAGTLPNLTAEIATSVNNPVEGIAGFLPELTASISATNTPPDVYVAGYLSQFTAAIAADSTFAPTVLRLCTHSFTTDSASTPANTHLPARIKNPGNYSRAINLDEFGLVRPAFGEVVINNIDGQYDYLIDNGFDGQKIKLWYGKKGATFPDDFIQVLVGIADAVQFDSQYIKLTLKDNLALLDQPVMNEKFLGTGGSEGTAEWTDRRKQRLFGGKEFVPVQLIDADKLIYFVSKWADDDPLIYSLHGGFQPDPFLDEDTMSAWEGGVWIEREANYASISEMETFEPSTGKCRFLIDGSGTYVRLATNPEYEVRVTVPSIRTNDTNQTLTHQMLITEVVPSDDVWTGGGGAVQDIFANDESMTYADVIEQMAIKDYSIYWSDRFGQLRRNYFQIPGFKGNNRPVKYEFNESNIKSINVKQAPHYYRVEFKAGLNFPSVPAPAATAERKEKLLRTGYTYTETRESNVIRNRHKSAKVKQILSHAATYDDSRSAAADAYESVYIQPRQFVEIEHARGRLTQDLLGIDITDHVTLQYPRFGFDNGKTMLVLAVRHDYSTGTLRYTLWG